MAQKVLNEHASEHDRTFTMNLLNDVYSKVYNSRDDKEAFANLESVISYHERVILSEKWNSDENYALGTLAVIKHSTNFWKSYNFSTFSNVKAPNARNSAVVGYVVGGVTGAATATGSFLSPAGTVGGFVGGKLVGAATASATVASAIAVYDYFVDFFS